MIIIGIDPGLKGGIAIYSGGLWAMCPMPKANSGGIDVDGVRLFIKSYTCELSDCLAVLEKVHSMPGQGVTSMFTFGEGYGEIKGMLKTLEISFINPTPQQWMKRLGLKKLHKKDKPGVKYVQQQYPNLSLLATKRSKKPHDGMADAICLCEYGMKGLRK